MFALRHSRASRAVSRTCQPAIDRMRVLLDECVNPRVKDAFPGHTVRTVKEMGWGGITNGKLMVLAQQSFDVFVTVDQNLEYQQNVAKLTLGLVIVAVPDNN